MRRSAQIRPAERKRIVKLRLRVQVTNPDGGTVTISDVLLQAGGTATGWVAHVTEMPWTAGIVGG